MVNIVFIGHVDAGKSSLSGRILNASGNLAHSLDVTISEQEKGITEEYGVASFGKYTILDAPGHKIFMNNMIEAAFLADAAILVVSAKPNEFEKGLDHGTRDHLIVAKAVDIKHIIVAVNKMDLISWDKARYDLIVDSVSSMLKKMKIKATFCPVSAVKGQNVHENHLWTECSLLQCIQFETPTNNLPLRIKIASITGSHLNGKIITGEVHLGDKVRLLPCDKMATISYLNLNENNTNIGVSPFEKCSMISSVETPMKAVNSFSAQIYLTNITIVTCGFQCAVYFASGMYEVTIDSMDCQFMRSNQKAKVTFKGSNILLEDYKIIPKLGRFILGTDRFIGYGIVSF